MKISVLLTLIVLAASGCIFTKQTTSVSDNNTAKFAPQLKLLSKSSIIKFGYVAVEGDVQNISGEKIEGLQAVASHYGADGQLVKREAALIESDPLLPDQTSHYKVMTPHDPAMQTFTVAFKRATGGGLYLTDGSPRDAVPGKEE